MSKSRNRIKDSPQGKHWPGRDGEQALIDDSFDINAHSRRQFLHMLSMLVGTSVFLGFFKLFSFTENKGRQSFTKWRDEVLPAYQLQEVYSEIPRQFLQLLAYVQCSMLSQIRCEHGPLDNEAEIIKTALNPEIDLVELDISEQGYDRIVCAHDLHPNKEYPILAEMLTNFPFRHQALKFDLKKISAEGLQTFMQLLINFKRSYPEVPLIFNMQLNHTQWDNFFELLLQYFPHEILSVDGQDYSNQITLNQLSEISSQYSGGIIYPIHASRVEAQYQRLLSKINYFNAVIQVYGRGGFAYSEMMALDRTRTIFDLGY